MIPRKTYGMTSPKCFFCKEGASTKNEQGLPTCRIHKESESDSRCPACSKILDIKEGKYGAYFFCYKCMVNWSIDKIKNF